MCRAVRLAYSGQTGSRAALAEGRQRTAAPLTELSPHAFDQACGIEWLKRNGGNPRTSTNTPGTRTSARRCRIRVWRSTTPRHVWGPSRPGCGRRPFAGSACGAAPGSRRATPRRSVQSPASKRTAREPVACAATPAPGSTARVLIDCTVRAVLAELRDRGNPDGDSTALMGSPSNDTKLRHDLMSRRAAAGQPEAVEEGP